MCEINLLVLAFTTVSIIVSTVGLLMHFTKSLLPSIVLDIFYYGKCEINVDDKFSNLFKVSKSWYKHFYIVSSPLALYTLGLIIYVTKCNGDVPKFVLLILDSSLGKSRKALISPECALLAVFLINFHCWKRLYESHCVNIFSDKKMNLLHYIFGILHYFGILIAVIGETHSFTKGSHMPLNWRNLTIYHYLLAAIFFWVGIEQHKANLILRNLRKDKTGRFMNSGYAIPTGQLYNYISSPLQFLEILVYMILSLILWQANSFHFITIWVIANQITCCWMNQEWYTNTFSNYPKERKILIPFIY